MTNLGFRLAMAEHGIEVVETPVGDRYVLEALDRGGWSLGGEQSGHVIFRDLATTGDGLLTGLSCSTSCRAPRRPLAELAAGHDPAAPGARQRAGRRRRSASTRRAVAGPRSRGRGRARRPGRVLVRPSGTEPLVRVMVEAAHPRRGRPGRRPSGRCRGPGRRRVLETLH